MKLNQIQQDLILGSLLGDGNLQTNSKGRTWRYRALQMFEHKPYLDHKYEILKSLCGSPPIYSKIYDERTKKNYERWYFNTLIQDCLRYYANRFYTLDPITQTFKKDVPDTIHQDLTPRAIAYWYMDDGSMKWIGRSNAMRICTESFSEGGIKRLQNVLKKQYDIETQLIRKTAKGIFIGYRMAINEKNSIAFRGLIRPYLIDCMKYKVSDGNKLPLK